MNNTVQRFLMFFTFIPGIACIVIFLPGYHHLVLQGLVGVFAVGTAFETARLFGIWTPESRKPLLSLALVGVSLLPVGAEALHLAGLASSEAGLGAWFVSLTVVFASRVVLAQRQEVSTFFPVSWLIILAYPVLGLLFIMKMLAWPMATEALLCFFASVFLNDSMAYFGGRFFGAKSPRPIRLSPNKTLVGFLTGFVFSPITFAVTFALAPAMFPRGLSSALLIGLAIGLSTIFGDLFESGIKRSHGAKDSGSLILGRGGLLDSTDSLLFSAPVFYYLYVALALG